MGRYGSGFDASRMASFHVQQDEVKAKALGAPQSDNAAHAFVRFIQRILPKKQYDEARIIEATQLPGMPPKQ